MIDLNKFRRGYLQRFRVDDDNLMLRSHAKRKGNACRTAGNTAKSEALFGLIRTAGLKSATGLFITPYRFHRF